MWSSWLPQPKRFPTPVLECLIGRATPINRFAYFSIRVYGQGANNSIIISYQGASLRRTKLASCALGYIMWCFSKYVLASFYILGMNWLVTLNGWFGWDSSGLYCVIYFCQYLRAPDKVFLLILYWDHQDCRGAHYRNWDEHHWRENSPPQSML